MCESCSASRGQSPAEALHLRLLPAAPVRSRAAGHDHVRALTAAGRYRRTRRCRGLGTRGVAETGAWGAVHGHGICKCAYRQFAQNTARCVVSRGAYANAHTEVHTKRSAVQGTTAAHISRSNRTRSFAQNTARRVVSRGAYTNARPDSSHKTQRSARCGCRACGRA